MAFFVIIDEQKKLMMVSYFLEGKGHLFNRDLHNPWSMILRRPQKEPNIQTSLQQIQPHGTWVQDTHACATQNQ